jgi:hypothetical protein
MQLLKEGKFPEEVHFDVKRYSLDEILGEEEVTNNNVDASRWLADLWKAKEQRLKDFYEKNRCFIPSGDGYVWPVSSFKLDSGDSNGLG